MIFTSLTVGLAVFTVLFLLVPLFSRKNQQPVVERNAVNVKSAAKRLSELKQELADGQITEEQFKNYRLELETATLEDLKSSDFVENQDQKANTLLAIIVALCVPLLSLFIYQKLGNEQAFHPQAQQEHTADSMAELDKILASIEADVEKNPEDLKSWFILGQAYFEMRRYAEAENAYEKAYELSPDDADILVNYAEAIGRANANDLAGKPKELLNKALALIPNHERALWLAGFAEMQTENAEAAREHWSLLLASLEAGSEGYQQVEKLIAEIDTDPSPESTGTTETDVQGNDVKRSIAVTVSLAAELQDKVDADTTLFVFARASEGPPMPLAVHKTLAKEIPLTVTLDDSMAMMPEMSLSRFPKVIIGARLSSNGQPQGQAGDYEGYSEVIETASTSTVEVVINKMKP